MTNDDLRTVSARVGRNIRWLRTRQELTLEDLASRLEEFGQPMNFGTVAKAERGQRNISVDEVQAFSKALGVSVEGLMTSPDEVMTVMAIDAWLQRARRFADLQSQLDDAEKAMASAASNVGAHAQARDFDLDALVSSRLAPYEADLLLSQLRELDGVDQ